MNVSNRLTLAIGERVGKASTDLLRSLLRVLIMRDFRDAKAMARSLRDALAAKATRISHSESLELISRALGYENWNVLAAKIDGAQPRSVIHQSTASCSFCGKNQREVSKLVAGPSVFICDGCVALCSDYVDDQLASLIDGDDSEARAMSTDRLLHYVEHARNGAERNRSILQEIDGILAQRTERSQLASSGVSSLSHAGFRNKTSGELLAWKEVSHEQLRRYEQALRTATPIIDERAGR